MVEKPKKDRRAQQEPRFKHKPQITLVSVWLAFVIVGTLWLVLGTMSSHLIQGQIKNNEELQERGFTLPTIIRLHRDLVQWEDELTELKIIIEKNKNEIAVFTEQGRTLEKEIKKEKNKEAKEKLRIELGEIRRSDLLDSGTS